MYNPFSLKNKHLLITGASSGIGRAIAIECSKMGASLVITGRNEEQLKATLEQMDRSQNHVMVLADLLQKDDIERMVDDIENNTLDGVVQCAGFTIAKPFQFFSVENMNDIMAVNFEAPVYLSQLLLKRKKITRGASIVFISSISGVYCSSVAGSMYSASKGAINGIVKGMAIELAIKDIRVNCVNPGMINTNIFSSDTITKEQLEEDTKKYPLRRYGNPEEVAYAVIYLLSDASRWVTGTNLKIDGGYTLL